MSSTGMRMNMAPTRNSQSDQVLLSGGANQNSPGDLVSSSIEKETSDHLLPPILENSNSYTSDDDDDGILPPKVENHDLNVVVAQANNPGERRHNHRHSEHQIRFMENFYQKVSRPNKRQREDIANELGLDHLQVKFWFQNTRTQKKAQEERATNDKLRVENEKLREENAKLKQKQNRIVNCCTCPNSDLVEMPPEECKLRLENIQLNKELERIMAIAKTVIDNQNMPPLPPPPPARLMMPTPLLAEFRKPPSGPTGGVSSINNVSIIPNVTQVVQLAVSSMEEFVAMATLGEPLWLIQPTRDSLLLNELEYSRIFRRGVTKLEGIKSEATRESTIIMMDAAAIIEMMMNLDKWLTMFTSMISKGTVLEVLSPGVSEHYDGAMGVMFAEYQALSPVVPTRDCIFVRYCKKLREQIWGVLDVSIDTLLQNGGPMTKCQKRPSGCIIQELQTGYSKITWVEHVEVQEETVHNLAKPIISSGNAYGAKRWISILERQCERLTNTTVQSNLSHYCHLNGTSLGSPRGRPIILKFAERMVFKFNSGVTAPYTNYPWKIISGNGFDQVRVMINTILPNFVHDNTTESTSHGGGSGGGTIVVCASRCFWMPILPKDVLSFLNNERNRTQWDVLINGGVQEIVRINNGTEDGINCVAILRALNSQTNQRNMIIMQESSSEPTLSTFIYAPIDPVTFGKLFHTGTLDELQFLPSGFTILPSGPPDDYVISRSPGRPGRTNAIVEGSLLTVSFQVEVDSSFYSSFPVAITTMVTNLVETTINKIKDAFGVTI